MFSYCLNNPINFLDKIGEDAIWIQEEQNVGTMGHSGLLVQDKNGDWFFFFWGGTPESTPWELFWGANYVFHLIKLDTEGLDMRKREDVVKAVSQVDELFAEERKRSEWISGDYYYEGDFSATYEYLVQYEKEVSGTRAYNLLLNNCAQVSCRAMAKSDLRFVFCSAEIIPNLMYLKVSALYFG